MELLADILVKENLLVPEKEFLDRLIISELRIIKRWPGPREARWPESLWALGTAFRPPMLMMWKGRGRSGPMRVVMCQPGQAMCQPGQTEIRGVVSLLLGNFFSIYVLFSKTRKRKEPPTYQELLDRLERKRESDRVGAKK